MSEQHLEMSKGDLDFAWSFDAMSAKIHQWAIGKGFWFFELGSPEMLIVATKLALIHSEVSEALEAHRSGTNDDKLTDKLGLEVELADAVIRIMDLAAALKLDLGKTIVEKMAYNEGRPFKHGKAY